ncbi:MAG: hemolysin D [Pirellulaceae bacterium]|nr:MAG: hemolysin D [Pirellulaceae bacterium]
MVRWLTAVGIFLAGCVVGMLGVWGWRVWQSTQVAETSAGEGPDGSVAAGRPPGVWALGRLEPASGVIEIMGVPGDRLLSLDVEPGSEVVAGQRLGQWESELQAAEEVALIEAQLAEAERRFRDEQRAAERRLELAQLAEEHATSQGKLQLQAEQKRVELLRFAVEVARRRCEQQAWLVANAPDLVVPHEEEELAWALRKAELELDAAEAAYDAMRLAAEQKNEQAVRERQAAEEALARLAGSDPLQTLRAQHKLAVSRQRASQLLAPRDGHVIRVHMQPGERAAQQPVLQLADLSHMVCVAEVPFDQVGGLRVGQQARIHSRAFGGDAQQGYLAGKVAHIGITAGRPELRRVDPFAPAEQHAVEVRVELDPKASQIAARWLFLQVEVEFLPESSAE